MLLVSLPLKLDFIVCDSTTASAPILSKTRLVSKLLDLLAHFQLQSHILNVMVELLILGMLVYSKVQLICFILMFACPAWIRKKGLVESDSVTVPPLS